MTDPASPVPLSTFATDNTNDPDVALEGRGACTTRSCGKHLYASWYSDSVRVIDLSRPSAPREVASCTEARAPAHAPAVNIWRVVPHGNLLLASDRNFGLYILRHTP